MKGNCLGIPFREGYGIVKCLPVLLEFSTLETGSQRPYEMMPLLRNADSLVISKPMEDDFMPQTS